MQEDLSFLDADVPAEVTPTPAATPAPVPAETQPASPVPAGQPRHHDGKFAPKAADPAPAPAAPVSPQADPAAPPPGFVPIGVVQQLREEMRALRNPPPPPPKAPDRYEDPDGYEQHQAAQFHTMVLSTKLDVSEDMARGKHGDALVDAARAWALERFGKSPAYQQEVFGSRNPYEKIVSDHQRDQLLADVKADELSEFRAWKAAQAAASANPTASAAPAASPTPTPTPPRSILHSPAAGGLKPGQTPVLSADEAFDRAFER